MTQQRPSYELKVAKTQDEIESCYQMRIEVFSVEQGFPLETEIDEYDPVSIHFLLTTPIPLEEASTSLSALLPSSTPAQEQKQTSKPIGTIRFVPQLGKITRLVVLKDYRSFGFGKVLMEGVEDYLAKLKQGDLERFGTVKDDQGKTYITVKIHSQLQVEKFYAKFGYKPVGPQFDEEGELHQKMIKDIEINA